MAPKPPRAPEGREEVGRSGRRRAHNPLLLLQATPASRAFPPSPSARGPALQARARHGDPGRAARPSPQPPASAPVTERKAGAGAGGRSYQGGARSLTRTDPAASVPAPAAPFQALGRTSGRGAGKLRNPREGFEGPAPARGGRRGSAWTCPRDDARRRAVRRVASGCGNPFGRL